MDNLDAKIMLVDDSPMMLMSIEKLLSSMGFDIFIYQEPQKAIEMAEIVMPDLVILDINMPGINGFDVCKQLKSISSISDIAIIFISGVSTQEYIIKAFESGAVDFITKPFLFEDLTARVLTHIKIKKKVDFLNNLLKDSFHELYAPLGVIESSVEIIKNKSGTSTYLERIALAVKSLQSTYKDIYYALKNEQVAQDLKTIELGHYLNQQASSYEALAAIKSMIIEIQSPSKDMYIQMSDSALDRIVSNTLANAIKYGKAGSIITIVFGEIGKRVFFEVKNLGVISESKELVFKRHFQGSKASTGLGLGLDIVKSICINYDIDIDLSTDDKSTTFRYIFSEKVSCNM